MPPPEPPTASAEDGTTQTGFLRSELDADSGRLPPIFVDLLSRYLALRQQVRQGRTDRWQAARLFSGLRAIDTEGYEWTLGASSGSWYRRAVGGDWLAAPPPMTYGTQVGPGGQPADGSFPDIPGYEPQQPEPTATSPANGPADWLDWQGVGDAPPPPSDAPQQMRTPPVPPDWR